MILTGKAKDDFWKWFLLPDILIKNNLKGMFNFRNEVSIKIHFLSMPETCKNALIINWFDSVGITVDVMPRMNDDKIVFEPNTFCLKEEITTDDFIQFETRKEATTEAIKKANEIYNKSWNKEN